MTVDMATIVQLVGQVGVAGLLGIALHVVWKRLCERESKIDRINDAHAARQERVIAYLTGNRPATNDSRGDDRDERRTDDSGTG